LDFEQVLKEVVWRLVTEGSISYRRIKLSFGLDDDGLEELRRELIVIKQVAADVDGEVLVWAPEGRVARPEPAALLQPVPALRPAERPDAPAAIAAAPEAERRHLTVMFCDLVGSRHSPPGWTPKICAMSSRRIRSGAARRSGAMTALSRSTWATASWSFRLPARP